MCNCLIRQCLTELNLLDEGWDGIWANIWGEIWDEMMLGFAGTSTTAWLSAWLTVWLTQVGREDGICWDQHNSSWDSEDAANSDGNYAGHPDWPAPSVRAARSCEGKTRRHRWAEGRRAAGDIWVEKRAWEFERRGDES